MRYFLFNYTYTLPKNIWGFGIIGMESETFPTRQRLSIEAAKGNNPPITIENIIMQGWNEFKTEQDYNDFYEIEDKSCQ